VSVQTNQPTGNNPTPNSQGQTNASNGDWRVKDAVWLAGIGIVLTIVLVVILLAFSIKTSNDIVAVVGSFTTLVGTLVGLIIGGGVGSQGKAAADTRADVATTNAQVSENKATKAQADAKALAGMVKATLAKHEDKGLKAMTVDSLSIQADLQVLRDFSETLL
jgi:hypothetical protein